MPAPISTTSTFASIAPNNAARFGSWIFSSRLIPTRPACCALARKTSAKLLMTTRSSKADDIFSVGTGFDLNGASVALPPAT